MTELTKVEKYKAAIETHRHYDTLSQALVLGMGTVAGVSFVSLDKGKIELYGAIPIWGGQSLF